MQIYLKTVIYVVFRSERRSILTSHNLSSAKRVQFTSIKTEPIRILMKKFIYFAILVFGLNLMICAAQEDKAIQPVQTWNGKKIDNKQLETAPKNVLFSNNLDSVGFISTETDWIKLWQAWRKDETPKIDFTKNLIVFCTTQTPNICQIYLKLSKSGDLKISPLSTLLGSKDKTFNYRIVLIDRAGIKSIERKPIIP